MKIIYPRPGIKVSLYVRAMLIIENEQVSGPFVLPLFANGTPTLLFTTSPGCLGEREQHLMLFGQTVLPRQLLIRDNFKLIAYFLQPWALSALFNISATELTDQPIALDMLAEKSTLQEQLLNAATTDELLQLIDEYLYRKITTIRRQDKRLIYAAEKIAQTTDKHILMALQRDLCMTERTFQRLFDEHIGVSPNLFRRINQFNSAFRQINGPQLPDFSAIAYGNGYADQSHMIRAFKEFTHLTPSAYLHIRQDA